MLVAMIDFKRELVLGCGLMWMSHVFSQVGRVRQIILPISFSRLVCDLTLDSLSPGLVKDSQ